MARSRHERRKFGKARIAEREDGHPPDVCRVTCATTRKVGTGRIKTGDAVVHNNVLSFGTSATTYRVGEIAHLHDEERRRAY